jgi:hypothetical protein
MALVALTAFLRIEEKSASVDMAKKLLLFWFLKTPRATTATIGKR